MAKATTPFVSLLKSALHPVVSLLIWFADLQAPGQGIAGTAGITEDELRRMAAQAAQSGEIGASDLELMERAFRLGDQRVDDILVPRIDVISVGESTPVREALEIAVQSGHRRLPVYGTDPDDMGGVVRLRDLAAAVADDMDVPVSRFARPVLVVPESKRVIDLLREMQNSGRHFAVAVDEHGGTAGIVTIEDVVEELVGDVADEGEARKQAIKGISPGRWLVDARISTAELADALDAELPAGDWNTVGGLVIGMAGRIPRVGETVTIDGFVARVTEASRRRVREIELERT